MMKAMPLNHLHGASWRMCRAALFPLLIHLMVACIGATLSLASTVNIDTATTYQTIRGWGCVNYTPPFLTPEYRKELINEAVNQYGLTRIRLEIPAGNATNDRRWEWRNDGEGSSVTNWTAFNLEKMQERIDQFVGPFAELVEANGDPFELWTSPSFYTGGSSGDPPAWLLNNPGEYTEWALSMFQRLKYVHGIEPKYHVILNEASYQNLFSRNVVLEMAYALCPRMEAEGFSTKLQFPESVNVDTAYNNFIVPSASDEELWSWVGVVSYHRYGTSTKLADLAAFANSKGMSTAFTELLSLTLDRMYDDLTIGMVSYWEVYAFLGDGGYVSDNAHYNYLERSNNYWKFRQVMHYVRPGATRVKASSPDDATIKLLAWAQGGKTLLHFYNLGQTGGAVTITGLTPGTYGLCSTKLTAAFIERGLRTVGSDGTLTLTSLDTAAFYLLYPHPGGNQPPVFTQFKPSVGYLVSPASSFTLSAAAQDSELDPISFRWEVTKAPAGASVLLAAPGAATCAVSGLAVPGDYAFSVTASDASGSARRDVRMQVFPGNPPPVIVEIHNRSPVLLTLPASSTSLRSEVWNVDSDPLTYQWSVVSQPSGADAQFSAPTTEQTDVSGMIVAGDYVFRLTVSDGTTTAYQDHTVPVYPLNTTPTVTASANPSNITLPVDATALSSTSGDADGDALTHWWRIKSAPAGAQPVFSTRNAANTNVVGLIIPGTYVFEHVVTDESSFKTASVTVTVGAGSAPEILFLAVPNGGENYQPGQNITIRWAAANFTSAVKLEFFDGTNWTTIAASTPNDGREAWTVPATSRTNCRIRISDAADGLPSDESDASFRIVGPELFRILKIDGNFATGPTLQWSSLPGGYSYQVYYSETLNAGDWRPVGSSRVAQNGQFDLSFTDASAIGKVRRFYKVVETPIE